MPLRIAVVGAGKFGKRHIATLAKLQDEGLCSLNAIVDVAAPQLRKVGDYGCKLETSISNVLPDVDVVDIVTPASTHYALAKEILLANKHVIIEKPMAVSYEEAGEIHSLGVKKN
ncbi:MAG TPA: Gfo/Idh/MocA family oxidoreductase, partial [Candidatus Bathyarchaeia archaeon]|nr:Gfo/Idh/MocA family oxidoreductase [Candidatus Bathyarchaeia archaeon]